MVRKVRVFRFLTSSTSRSPPDGLGPEKPLPASSGFEGDRAAMRGAADAIMSAAPRDAMSAIRAVAGVSMGE
jgi:hypothetical protein